MNTNEVKDFLSENRNEVISYYNEKISTFYSISLKDFMLDILNNFRKITLGDDLKKMDLFGNLESAKSRLGLFTCEVVARDKKTEELSKKYKGTSYMSMV